jgi:hypothetical protein
MESHNAQIQRAAALTQKLFFQFGEMNFVLQPSNIKEKGGELLIAADMLQQGKFIKFDPNVVMPGTQQSMVVSHFACSSAAIYFRDLLTKFLEGRCPFLPIQYVYVAKSCEGTNTRVGVTTLSLTPLGTITQYVDAYMSIKNGRCRDHTLIKIFDKEKYEQYEAEKLNKSDKSDEDRPAEWIIDLSGPQFSIFDPCLKPDIYCKKYKTSKHADLDPNSDIKAGAQKCTKALEFGMTQCIVKTIEEAIEAWEDEKKVRIAELLANGNHESLETELLGFVEKKMVELREDFDWTDHFIERGDS